MAARFYVYALFGALGEIAYIGKGSRYRLAAQRRNHGLLGHELARFFKEADAYAFERVAIAEHRPARNKHPGGNGSRATKQRKPHIRRTINGLSPRVYAARFLDANWERLAPYMADASWSKLHEIRQVAYAG